MSEQPASEPDHIGPAIMRIAAEYPPRYPIRYMDPVDQQTILSLQSIPRPKA